MNTAIVNFASNLDGGWQGNGFGTCPNSYTVTVDGVDAGVLHRRVGDDRWVFARRVPTIIDGVEFDYERTPSVVADSYRAAVSATRELLSNPQPEN